MEDTLPPPLPDSATLETPSSPIPSLYNPGCDQSLQQGDGQCCSLFLSLFSCYSFLRTCFLFSNMSTPQVAAPLGVPAPPRCVFLSSSLAVPFSQYLSPFFQCVFTEAPHTWLIGSAVSCGGSAEGPDRIICVRNTMSLRKDKNKHQTFSISKSTGRTGI